MNSCRLQCDNKAFSGARLLLHCWDGCWLGLGLGLGFVALLTF